MCCSDSHHPPQFGVVEGMHVAPRLQVADCNPFNADAASQVALLWT